MLNQITNLNSLSVPLAPSTSSTSPSRCPAKTKNQDSTPALSSTAAAGNRRRGQPPSISKKQKVNDPFKAKAKSRGNLKPLSHGNGASSSSHMPDNIHGKSYLFVSN